MISLDWTLFLQMAIFLSFTYIINTFLFRPMAQYRARRASTIIGLREGGGEQDAALEKIQSEYSQKMNEVREELLSQRTAARKEVMDIHTSILDEAKKEANQELNEAESELAKDIVASRDTLEKDVRVLAGVISEKILGRTLQ